MKDTLKGIVITLFVIGLLWFGQSIFCHSTVYAFSLLKLIGIKSIPGLFLMMPAIIWGVWHIWKEIKK